MAHNVAVRVPIVTNHRDGTTVIIAVTGVTISVVPVVGIALIVASSATVAVALG
jgi:hypothetical protein